MDRSGPLKGLKVLELGQYVAGPFCTRLLAEFGAEIIKIEAPGSGDPLRKWRMMAGDTSLWWQVQSRNKQSVTVDLHRAEGQAIVRQLAAQVDILVENFRPGTLEQWGLGWEALQTVNPGLILVRISGYGQDGPYRDRPGFGSIGEAMGGLRFVTGFPNHPPVRSGVSLGDSLTGLYGALGALMAVHARDVGATRRGQVVDVALYEAVFSLMESTLPEYDRFQHVRERSGNRLPGVTPTSTYECSDGTYAIIAGNGDAIFRRLMRMVGRPDLAEDPAMQTNDGRVPRANDIEGAIEDWVRQLPLAEVLARCEDADVPAGRVYTIADIVRDPHYLARGMIQTAMLPDGPVKVPGIVPRLSDTPGAVAWHGPALGEHTDRVLSDMLGMTEQQIAVLRDKKVV